MAIAVDQASLGTTATVASATTIVLTTTAAVAVGGFIVLFIGWENAGTVTVSVAGGGLTWAVDVQGKHDSQNPHSAIATAQAPAGLASSTAITATFSSTSTGRAIAGSSFTGIATASALDAATAPVAGGGGTTWTTPNVTTTNADDLLVGMQHASNAAGPTSAIDSPATELHDFSSDFDLTTTGYRIVTSTGTYAISGTWSASIFQDGGPIAAYKGAAPKSLLAPSFRQTSSLYRR